MPFAPHAENHVVAGQRDLDEDLLRRHLAQQPDRVVLVHHVHAVADPQRVALPDGFADMKTQRLGRHHALDDLTGVQRDADGRVDTAAENRSSRMCSEKSRTATGSSSGCTRFTPAMRGSRVASSNPARICANTCSGGPARSDLRDVPDRHAAAGVGGRGRRSAAGALRRASADVEPLPGLREDGIEVRGEQPRPHLREVAARSADCAAEARRDVAVRRQHQLEVADVLGRRPRRHLGQHVPHAAGRRGSNFVERREEMIVAVEVGRPVAHRQRVDGAL